MKHIFRQHTNKSNKCIRRLILMNGCTNFSQASHRVREVMNTDLIRNVRMKFKPEVVVVQWAGSCET